MYTNYSVKPSQFFSKTKGFMPDVYDSHKRKLLKGSFQKIDQRDIILAHHSLVTPAYLIEIEKKTNVDNILHEIINGCLKIGGYIKNAAGYDGSWRTNEKNSNKVSEFSFAMIAEDLKKEIDRYYHAKIDRLTTVLERNINSFVKKTFVSKK